MRVQVVLDQHDLLGIGEVHIAKVLENAGIIDRSAVLGNFDMAQAFEGANSMNRLAVPLRSYS
jgi:hypothetical protein